MTYKSGFGRGGPLRNRLSQQYGNSAPNTHRQHHVGVINYYYGVLLPVQQPQVIQIPGSAETVCHQGTAVTVPSTPQVPSPGSFTGYTALSQGMTEMNTNIDSKLTNSEGIQHQTQQFPTSTRNTPLSYLPLREVWERDGKFATAYYKFVISLFLFLVAVCPIFPSR
ncbi:hypothetical protein ACMFMG_010455 [Clarireedia jacksonii]